MFRHTFIYFKELNFTYRRLCSYSIYDRFCYVFSDSEFNPPIAKPNGKLIPLKNNVAGKMTGLELIMKSLITEYFPNDKRFKGYNVRHRRVFEIRDRDKGKNIIFLYVYIIKLISPKIKPSLLILWKWEVYTFEKMYNNILRAWLYNWIVVNITRKVINYNLQLVLMKQYR